MSLAKVTTNSGWFVNSGSFVIPLVLAFTGQSYAIDFSVIETGSREAAAQTLVGALLGSGSEISVAPNTEQFIGSIGPQQQGQSATFTNFSLVPSDAVGPMLVLPDGIFLTTGTANMPVINTLQDYSVSPGTGANEMLSDLSVSVGGTETTFDQNVLSFQFTVPSRFNAIQALFSFGTEEYPTQTVTDIFGFFVDGVNYAIFPDGTLVRNVPEANFVDNPVGEDRYAHELNGITEPVSIVGLLDPDLDVHTLVIAIADTSDTLFDSGVWISMLRAVFATTGGIGIPFMVTELASAAATQSSVNSSQSETAVEAVNGVLADAAEFSLGLAGGNTAVEIAPNFGIFASGQFASVDHEGFSVSNGGIVDSGPDFTASDFSAAFSLDFNAASHFGFDDRYGLNIGVFGGYTSTDVDVGPFQIFQTVGRGRNQSSMFGTYGLFRQDFNYALLSATTFIGETDFVSNVLNSTGSYDTVGYAATASAGHIFVLSDELRFDLRGGIMGVTFHGDGFTDSQGNVFGKSRVSFGAVKFDPGIYGDFRLDNGMVLSPYARAELQQRFGYRNTANAGAVTFDFDDSDFSASLSTGFNLRMSPSTTMSAEVRGKVSADSSTIAGKFGLKVSF